MPVNPGQLVGGNSSYGRVKSDFYPTPPDATIALMNFLRLPIESKIWEPACGENDIVYTLKKMGYNVVGTDINNGTDFLVADPVSCDWIITNPPFSISQEFIWRCIELKKPFALLLKSNYWQAKKRFGLFKSNQPKYVLPLTWRLNFFFKRKEGGSPLMDVAWFVWDGKSNKTEFIPLEKPITK